MEQCQAKSKRTKNQCQCYAMKGMRVCYHHGGRLGSKKTRRARRLAVLKHGFFTHEAIQERKETRQLIKAIAGSLGG
ncbi:MAG: hypothetical protein WCP39_05925 [Chlamydiota bacterium]